MEFKKNILVVDDDPDVVAIIKGILHSGEYEIQSVCRGREVFARLEEKRPEMLTKQLTSR
ncbi:MAG: hypothetical protein HYY47_01855 [Deltaproteobacteria bacterium]|nr:hypothetical protein [Deltaproteobacteria bacterium]